MKCKRIVQTLCICVFCIVLSTSARTKETPEKIWNAQSNYEVSEKMWVAEETETAEEESTQYVTETPEWSEEACQEAEKARGEVTYTYEELFGVDKIQEDEEVTQNTEAEESYKEFKSYDMNFIDHRCRGFEMSETLETALSQALLDDQFTEFVSTYEAEYNILTDEEREEYISQHDSTDILKSYEKSTAVEEDLWFGFTDSPICIIRHPIGEGEYAYYEFFPAGVFEEIPCLFRALGKNEEYYFIQWEEKICVITTKREADKLVGIATYCMQGEALYGWMIYQEKSENNSISTKYYGYAHDPKGYGTHWPEY